MRLKDLTGLRSGLLVVLCRVESPQHIRSKGVYWRCLCDCGNTVDVLGQNLTRGLSRTCGCKKKRILRKVPGDTIGRLTLVSRVVAKQSPTGRYGWNVKCCCGTEKFVGDGYLIRGLNPDTTISCGCYRDELLSKNRRRHGLTGTMRYAMFNAALTRAIAKGLPFEITLDDVPEIPALCPLLGIPLRKGNGGKVHGSPSLDRIRPDRGYVPGNLQIISDRANTIKSNASFQEFETIYANWKRQHDEFEDLL